MADLDAMYAKMAKGLRGQLRCETCGTTLTLSAAQSAAYLRRGWPECCGYTMLMERAARPPSEGGGEP